MKLKTIIGTLMFLLFLTSAMPGDETISKEGKVTVVNTTQIGKDIEGYVGPTPVKIYIERNKITKVEALRNQEGPKYMAKARKVLGRYSGVAVTKAQKMQVDAATGATYSSEALIKNVQRGLDYYKKNR